MNNRIPFTPFACSLLALSLVTACSDGGHSSNDDTPPPTQQEHKLRKVGSASELEAYLKNGLKTAAQSHGYISLGDPMGLPIAESPPPSADASAGGHSPAPVAFSNTTLIEEGVDEPDVVKSDGDLVYITVPANNGCYEICAMDLAAAEDGDTTDIAVGEPYPGSTQNRIRVLRVDDATHSSTEITHIDIPHSAQYDYQYITGVMLTDENKELVAITNASGNIYQNANPTEPVQWSSIWSWSFGSTIIDTFDISNTSSISHQHRIELDGYLLQSRRIENTLYVVTRFTPEVTIAGTSDAEKAEIDALSLAQLLPKVSIDGNESTQVSPDNCFVDAEAQGYPTLMVVTAIGLDDNSLNSSCVTANMYDFYMSKAALYLTQSEWTENNSGVTHIYKLALSDDGPIYRGEGSVQGTTTSNSNFAISEHDDVLRIATTTRDATSWTPTNHIHTLSENAGGDLQTLATLPNAQHPESIGKPGETIQGVRFVGDRAYVVTFLQVDPLYVVDLSDPANPFIAGQVEIPGFSTLLQPLGENLLLGIGRESNNLKIELYDMADPSAPKSIDKYLVADETSNSYSSSAAEWDHHALSLLPINNGVRVALPFSHYRYSDYSEVTGAISLSVDLLNSDMSQVIETEAIGDPYTYGYGETRVLLQSNTLHYIHGSQVWSGLWGSNEPMPNPK